MCGICGQFNFGSGAPVKWLHREVSKRLLPSEIIHRKKRGFAVNVVDGWFHQSLDGRIPQYLADLQSQVCGFLEPAAVQSMLRDHAAGRGDHHKILFSIVVLEQWLRSGRGRDVNVACINRRDALNGSSNGVAASSSPAST